MDANRRPLSAIVSYSHADQAHRTKLERTLSSLTRQGLLAVWSDQKISAGEHLDKAIATSLEAADIVLLLVSPDFVASDYCYLTELATAIARHEAGQSVVVPIIVRPTDWESLPFGRIKALPNDAKPITTWENEDAAWLDVAKAIRNVANRLRTRLDSRTTSTLKTSRDCLKEEFSRLHGRYERSEGRTAGILKTGLWLLDDCLDGFHSGDLITIASRPGLGHGDLGLGFALNAVLKEKALVHYVSPRDAGSRVMRRAVRSLGGVPGNAILLGDITEEEWPRVTSAITLLADTNLTIDDSARLSSDEMLDRLRSACSSRHVDLIVIEGVDYFVGISSGSKTETEASRVARSLRAMAREFETTIIVTLGLGPKLENRVDKRPVLSDLGAWHCLEHEADQVLFIYQNEFYESGAMSDGPAEILVAKNVHGGLGYIPIYARPQFGRFDSEAASVDPSAGKTFEKGDVAN